MIYKLIYVLALSAILKSPFIQEPKIPPDPKTPVTPVTTLPKAVLSGPTNAAAGEHIIISAKGTIGDDPKFKCIPPNHHWKAGRDLETNEMYVTFSSLENGKFTFVLGVNASGKTDIATYELTVGPPPPEPPPTPETFAQKLVTVFSGDTAALPKADAKIKLIAFMNAMATEASTSKDTMMGFDKLFKESAKTYLGETDLRATRSYIAQYLLLRFGKPSNVPVDNKLVKSVFIEVATALSNIP